MMLCPTVIAVSKSLGTTDAGIVFSVNAVQVKEAQVTIPSLQGDLLSDLEAVDAGASPSASIA